MAEPAAGSSTARASRAFTLPSHSPATSQRRSDRPAPHDPTLSATIAPAGAVKQRRGHERAQSSVQAHSVRHHHGHGHRHHRSQQIGAHDMTAAAQISELFSPVKTAASNALAGSKAGSTSASANIGARRGSSSERAGTGADTGIAVGMEKGKRKEPVQRPWRTDWSWADVQREKARNHRVEEHLRKTYTGLVSSTAHSAATLHERHASFSASLTATKTLVSQLRDLQRAASRHLDSLTNSSLPDLAASSRTHLAALERAHVAEGRTQLATLEARVATARKRTAELRDRVAVCAGKAAAHEERERAEMRRHKRRVGLVWGLLAAVLVVWIAAAVWRGQSTVGPGRNEWRSRGSEELRSVLRSKGVEWALDGDGEAVDESAKGRYKRRGGTPIEVDLGGKEDSAEKRIERMFELL